MTEQELTRRANTIARAHGYHKATTILIGSQDRVLSHTRYGYRKTSNGQYVSAAYRSKFGWKNTYYQAAQTVVVVGLEQG